MLITCPGCAKKLKVPGSSAGKKLRCPGCKVIVTVPAEPAAAPERPKATDGGPARKTEAPPQPAERPSPDTTGSRRGKKKKKRRARGPDPRILVGVGAAGLVLVVGLVLVLVLVRGLGGHGPTPQGPAAQGS